MIETNGNYGIFIGDYGITLDVGTDLGIISVHTKTPRRNKWITLNSISCVWISSIEEGYSFKDDRRKLHIRNPQSFIHSVLMRVKVGDIIDGTSKDIIREYRKNKG